MNGKNNLLFVCYGLGIGGVEKCLINLLNSMDTDKYIIDLLPLNPIYDLAESIKSDHNLLNPFEYVINTTDTMGEIKANGGVINHPQMFLRYCVFRLKNKFGENPWKLFRPINKHYDIAIAYSHDNWTMNYVLHKVNARRKVLWYHNGAYNNTGKRLTQDRIAFKKFDYVVAVSEDCKRILSNALQLDTDKLIVLKNICDIEAIREQAMCYSPDYFANDRTNIVTVGRLTKEKGADLAIEACRKLKDTGHHVLWHWVGDGNQRDIIEQRIDELQLSDAFVVEGNKTNPYPYIKKADIYVQPSYYEAYSTTITEAKVLGRAIVTTDVGGMREQIEHGKNGWIVDISADALAETISNLIDYPNLIHACERALEKEDWSHYNNLKSYYKTVFHVE